MLKTKRRKCNFFAVGKEISFRVSFLKFVNGFRGSYKEWVKEKKNKEFAYKFIHNVLSSIRENNESNFTNLSSWYITGIIYFAIVVAQILLYICLKIQLKAQRNEFVFLFIKRISGVFDKCPRGWKKGCMWSKRGVIVPRWLIISVLPFVVPMCNPFDHLATHFQCSSTNCRHKWDHQISTTYVLLRSPI